MDKEYIKKNHGSNLKSQARLAWGRWRIEYSVWGRKFPYLSFIMIHSYMAGQKYENVETNKKLFLDALASLKPH